MARSTFIWLYSAVLSNFSNLSFRTFLLSLINLFKQNKIAVKEADNAVIDGINLVLNWLDEERIHIVEEKCPNIIREFNSYIWDEKAQEKGEDKPVKQNDHALDALRYLLQTLYPNKKRGAYFVQ